MTLFSLLLSIYLVLLPLTGRFISGYLENIFFFFPPLFFLAYLLIKKPKQLFNIPSFIIITETVLTILFLFSCIFSKNPGHSFPELFIWVNCWLIINIFLITRPSEKIFLSAISIAAIIYSLIYFFHPFSLPLDNIFESSPPPCQLADFLIFAVPIILFFYHPPIKLIRPIFVLLFLTVIITSSSRAAIISLLIGVEIYHHFHPIRLFPKFRFLIYPLIISFLAVYFIFPGHFYGKTGLASRQLYANQALHGLLENPLLGIGPANFMYVSLKYGPTATGATQFAHSSLLQYISENGILFSLLIFGFIFYCFANNPSKKSIFFCLGLIGFTNSLISTTGWSSPAIFILSLVFILRDFHRPKTSFKIIIYLIAISIVLIIFCTKNLISLHYQDTGDYYRSLDYNPFNLESRLEIIKQYHDQTNFKPLFNNEYLLYQTLAENTPLPQGENYYYQTFSLNPHGVSSLYLQLFKYYSENSQSKKLNSLVEITQNQEALFDYQLYLKSRIAAIPFPQNEDFYYQLFATSQPNTNTLFYLDLLDNYVKTRGPQSPRLFSFLYILRKNFLNNPKASVDTKEIIAKNAFFLSAKYTYTTSSSETDLEYLKTATDLAPNQISFKIELASDIFWQKFNHQAPYLTNQKWDAYKIIYDCASQDPSPLNRFTCRQYIQKHLPGDFSVQQEYFGVDPFWPNG